ncbi:hypothetical protein AB3N04_06550 [Alkalihalophilus sp. As8PL]|uniref:Uncharacterized protein n=1 Tax=Alkalihalophilus sp. As8PL TaxID=3237103 RepID=A0AB39BVQ7_9BACI
MKKRMIVISLIPLLGLGCFFVVNAMNGDATALNDSFTKEFIAEEWVEDDFHLFESKTGQYRMLFPDRFQMISKPPEFYGRQGDGFEMWRAKIIEKNEDGISYDLGVTLRNELPNVEEVRLHTMLKNYSYNNKFQEVQLNDKTIVHGSSFWDPDEPRGENKNPEEFRANNFFGLVQDQNSNQSIEVVYSTICIKEELNCEINTEEQYKFALKIMKSIEFLD